MCGYNSSSSAEPTDGSWDQISNGPFEAKMGPFANLGASGSDDDDDDDDDHHQQNDERQSGRAVEVLT